MNWRNEPGDFLEDLLCPARDPHMPTEVENQLRGRLAEFRQRLTARESGTNGAPAATSRTGRWAWAAVLSAAAVILFAVVWRLFPSGDAWASVLEAVKSQPWVHCVGKLPDGKPIEVWFSLPRRVGASRFDNSISYTDFDLRVSYLYLPERKQVYRMPLQESAEEMRRYFQALFAAFGRGDKTLALPETEFRLVKQVYRDVMENGRAWREYELTFKFRAGVPEGFMALFRVDPESRLPRSCRLVLPDGRRDISLAINYPETGPADVYALGVPKTAELVDRVPGADLQRILEGLKAGRQRIEPYFALIVDFSADLDWSHVQTVHRAWRAGNKWRVERLFLPDLKKLREQIRSGQLPRPGGDQDHFTWWKKATERLRFEPLLVCDGKTACRYNVRYSKSVIRLDEDLSQLTFEVESVRPDTRLDRDDPRPSTMVQPEFLGYPSLISPSPFAKATVDASPKTGPPGTVLLYDQYRLNEPWDSPANREVLQSTPDVFRATGDAKSTSASYFVLVGATTVFPGQQPIGMRDIRDGASNTLLIVEAKRDIPWTKPEDIPYDPDKPLPALGGFDEAGFHAALADAAVHFLDKIDEPTLRALISRSGREIVRVLP